MANPIVKINRVQIRALSNPVRLEIHTSLRTEGPATAKELATRLGGDEMKLYYHLRLLARQNLIATAMQPAATKPETVYSVEARFLVEDLDLTKHENLRAWCDNIDTLLRASSKESRTASSLLRNKIHERSSIGRLAIRLSPKKMKELQKKLQDLGQWLDDNESPNGDRYSVSYFVLPIVK